MNVLNLNCSLRLAMVVFGFVWITLPGMTLPVRANPSTRDAKKALAIHATVPEATVLAASAQAIADEADKFIAESDATLQKRGPASLSPKQLAYFRGNLNLAIYNASRLQMMGEPISSDLQIRLQSQKQRTIQLAASFLSTQPGQVFRAKLFKQWAKSLPSREKRLAAIKEMLKSDELYAAEKAMDAFMVEADAFIGLLDSKEFNSYVGSYLETDGLVTAALKKKRTSDARATFQEAIQANLPDPAALKAWASSAAAALKESGTALNEEQETMSGPECLADLSKRWNDGHAGLQRVTGLRWALKSGPNANGFEGAPGPTPDSESSDWSLAAMDAMSTIITADAKWIQADLVPERHQAYLASIGELMMLGNASDIRKASKEAFKPLLAKNSVYQLAVERYDAATRDVLEFQHRIADQAARALSQEFADADSMIRANTQTTATSPGLFPAQGNQPMYPSIIFPSHATMTAITPNLLEKKVQVENAIPIGSTRKVSAARWNGRTYATVASISLPVEVLAQLDESLLVDDIHPALSLESHRLIQSASSGNYEVLGGIVKGAQIEPVITRFATMTPATAIIIPRGESVSPLDHQSMLNQLAVRVDVQPTWVHYGWGLYRLEN